MSKVAMSAKLAEYVRAQASWRALKAEEYPEDVRNERAAARLRELATYVENQSDGDARLRAIEAAQEQDDLDVFAPGEKSSGMVSRFGFDREEDEGEFLTRLAAVVVEETAKEREELLEQQLWSPEVDELLDEMDEREKRNDEGD